MFLWVCGGFPLLVIWFWIMAWLGIVACESVMAKPLNFTLRSKTFVHHDVIMDNDQPLRRLLNRFQWWIEARPSAKRSLKTSSPWLKCDATNCNLDDIFRFSAIHLISSDGTKTRLLYGIRSDFFLPVSFFHLFWISVYEHCNELWMGSAQLHPFNNGYGFKISIYVHLFVW